MTPPVPSERPSLSAPIAGLILVALLLAVVTMGQRAVADSRGHQIERDAHVAGRLPSALRSAEAAARRRPGRVAFAVVLPDGRVVGDHVSATFRSASISKSLLAVTLLRSPRWSHDRGALSDGAIMIRRSDNAAATRVLQRVGDAAVRRAARVAGMRDYRISGSWAQSLVSARDFAGLMLRAPTLVPPDRRATLRAWLSGITPEQSWGIPRVLRPLGDRVMFKGGWRDGIVHQAARVEIDGRAFGIAVLTDHQRAGMAAGIATIERLSRLLLGRRVTGSATPRIPEVVNS